MTFLNFVSSAVKLMRPEIRYSEPVRLAVAAFSAIHSNNYSRFFIVLHQATYLQAALLHRYFTQVSSYIVNVMCGWFDVSFLIWLLTHRLLIELRIALLLERYF